MPATPRYTTRQDLPFLIEIGKDTVLACPVYRDGALVEPASATVTVYDAANVAVVSAAAASVVSSVAEYTLSAATTAALLPSSGWRVEFTLVALAGASSSVLLTSSAYLVRRRLYPTIADADVARRVPSLAITFAGRPTVASTYQGAIDEADTIVQRRLLEGGRRPWLLVEPWALREVWLTLTIAIVYEGLVGVAGDGDPYTARAAHWHDLYEAAWATAQSAMDWDQDGAADSTERTSAKPAGVWLC